MVAFLDVEFVFSSTVNVNRETSFPEVVFTFTHDWSDVAAQSLDE
jgi:hypothetical protein